MAQTSRLQVPETCVAPPEPARCLPRTTPALAQGRRAPGQRVLPGMGRGRGTVALAQPLSRGRHGMGLSGACQHSRRMQARNRKLAMNSHNLTQALVLSRDSTEMGSPAPGAESRSQCLAGPGEPSKGFRPPGAPNRACPAGSATPPLAARHCSSHTFPPQPLAEAVATKGWWWPAWP